MTDKVLCVDDDVDILNTYKQQLRKEFNIETAESGEEGLKRIAGEGPYAVVVSDLRMPGMDGITFLSKVMRGYPDTVRIVLTAYADLNEAINAVNKGNVYRFLTKPCSPEMLAGALSDGLDQYRLVTAEKELLEKTLGGTIKILLEMVSMSRPAAYGRADRIRRLSKQVAKALKIDKLWQVDLAAMLSQVGCVTVPDETLQKVYARKALSPKEKMMFENHPIVGKELLVNIPRLETVAEIIGYQEKRFDGSGIPEDVVYGEDIPIGARILKVALDFDTFVTSGNSTKEALTQMYGKKGWYDPEIMSVLESVVDEEVFLDVKYVRLNEITSDMILGEDVIGMSGAVLIPRGQEVTQSLRLRLVNYAALAGIKEPIKVLVKA